MSDAVARLMTSLISPTRALVLASPALALFMACSPADQVAGASNGAGYFNSGTTKAPDGGAAPADSGDPVVPAEEPVKLDSGTVIQSPDAGVRVPDPVTTRLDAGAGDAAAVAAACQMTFTVTTVSYGGDYAPGNIGAIWIADTNKKFVKTLKLWAAQRVYYLTTWVPTTKSNKVDAVTSATQYSHTARKATWDCSGVDRQPVPPGTYRVYAEYTESRGMGKIAFWDFAVGAGPVSLMPPDTTSFKKASLQLTQ